MGNFSLLLITCVKSFFQCPPSLVHVRVLRVLQTQILEQFLTAPFVAIPVEQHKIDVRVDELRDLAFEFEKFFDANRLRVVELQVAQNVVVEFEIAE